MAQRLRACSEVGAAPQQADLPRRIRPASLIAAAALGSVLSLAAVASLLTDRFDRMTSIAVGSAVLSSLLGIYWSYWLDASTAGCIVLVQTGLFLLSFLFAPRHGLVAQLRR
jgi:ABC-type Mn2+/Zn2+ transport system permease subunit